MPAECLAIDHERLALHGETEAGKFSGDVVGRRIEIGFVIEAARMEGLRQRADVAFERSPIGCLCYDSKRLNERLRRRHPEQQKQDDTGGADRQRSLQDESSHCVCSAERRIHRCSESESGPRVPICRHKR